MLRKEMTAREQGRALSKMMEMYSLLMKHLKENNEEINGAPFAIYHPCEVEGHTMLECGLPVSKETLGNDNINFIEISEGKTIMASHFGHYNTVKITYDAIQEYIAKNQLELNGSPWEMYITDPMQEPDQTKWETKVYFPIK